LPDDDRYFNSAAISTGMDRAIYIDIIACEYILFSIISVGIRININRSEN